MCLAGKADLVFRDPLGEMQRELPSTVQCAAGNSSHSVFTTCAHQCTCKCFCGRVLRQYSAYSSQQHKHRHTTPHLTATAIIDGNRLFCQKAKPPNHRPRSESKSRVYS
ncbi:hypothetical protein TYRP_005057 [Tyrophagus putrescentiae]|nr:hypothetical protein TYRP_005057 [Tyrophagus putrescentiae]